MPQMLCRLRERKWQGIFLCNIGTDDGEQCAWCLVAAQPRSTQLTRKQHKAPINTETHLRRTQRRAVAKQAVVSQTRRHSRSRSSSLMRYQMSIVFIFSVRV